MVHLTFCNSTHPSANPCGGVRCATFPPPPSLTCRSGPNHPAVLTFGRPLSAFCLHHCLRWPILSSSQVLRPNLCCLRLIQSRLYILRLTVLPHLDKFIVLPPPVRQVFHNGCKPRNPHPISSSPSPPRLALFRLFHRISDHGSVWLTHHHTKEADATP
jgi:hypothetical protein